MPQLTMTAAEFRALVAKEGARKYRNVRVVGTPDGDFDSGHEYRVWLGLKDDEKGGRKRNLRRQVRYPLIVNGTKICEYVADFVFEESKAALDGSLLWPEIVADAKGFRTNVYKLKKALMKACLGVEIREM